VIAIFLYEPIKNLLVIATDKFLFQKKEDAKAILAKLSKNIITILDINEVGKTILSTLEESMRLESGALIVNDEKNEGYATLDSFGLGNGRVWFQKTDPFLQYFKETEKTVNLDLPDEHEKLPEAVTQNMEKLKASVCIPLFMRGELTGILALGKKKSDQEYSKDEMDYFPTVAGQVAIALSNANLLEKLISERESKVKAMNEAKMVNYAKTIAHEIKNALVGVASTAMLLKTYDIGDLKQLGEKHLKDTLPKPAYMKFQKVLESIAKKSETIRNNGEKIRVIAKTAEGSLRSDEKAFEEIYFKIQWDQAKEESGVKDVSFNSELPQNFTIYANFVLLTRVLANLLKNAAEAMGEQQEKKIVLTCEYREIDGKRVSYFQLEDNGPGVPEDIRARIFEQKFSTKKKPLTTDMEASGHGHGLFMCKEIIEEIHKGRIWVEQSEMGGARFAFWIPMQESEEYASGGAGS